jgi:hypothetical protein
MRTLVVCLALTMPAIGAASAGSHTTRTLKPRATARLVRTPAAVAAKPACRAGCHIHKQRAAVRWLHKRVVKRSLQAYLPKPRSTRLSWRAAQVRHELAFWKKKDARTKTQARVPLARRIPRWGAWQCIARYESMKDWRATGGTYWGGLQMDTTFMHTYGADMIRRHHGGLANTWTSVEQIVVANRAWQTRGFQPWPVTSRICGLR